MAEPLPLHEVQASIFRFCAGREDATIFGAQAVNLFVPVPRMSQDVDILSPEPAETARALAEGLGGEFHIAARVREIKVGVGFRVDQKRSETNRHLADVRLLEFAIDSPHVVDRIRYVPLLTLFAMKLSAWSRRRLAPKGGTDLADLRRLLLFHRDDLANEHVIEAISQVGGGEEALRAWEELREQPMVSDDDFDDGY